MTYTITIDNSPQALSFIEFVKNLDFVSITKTKENSTKSNVVLNEQKELKKRFFKALKEADDIRAGKKEAIDLDELLNEL
ncbi:MULTISPECIES: hypothetical protein [Capnocytophaga]|jgi:hypothetical protein|uniref:Uncharacterized protein n=2 Tax=Capnocytophaga TaxID=1016 RepID=C7M9D5_CAPOD|nr:MULTISPECIES: hypothetical protein [Capnocytophaga]ACU92481.1 hypothetical protein Coch_0926 [Capnocytophaga ochracea DSM 7271]ASF42023.1 hypothetical protein CBG49_02345 [Capnocytophaga endodontalis]EJF35752.1 hypothetical protein HMPREF1320_2205 [Capnocytophaga sp. oral taxon 335 str. F0486]MBI1668544.1 hypothetical protein [Capnocytophaga periodontitidis]MBM0653068.1 hypothetical protein [Capnocytophaga genosp. AHN8471]